MTSALKNDKARKESLERLINSYEQAKTDGETKKAKMLKAIIDRIKYDQDKPRKT
jgi:hypothetical protein